MEEGNECKEKYTDDFSLEHMKAAIFASRDGSIINKHGGPFGAAVVKNGKIISLAHNKVISDQDSTCHAEMSALREAMKILETTNLGRCQLYSSCEPCPMCWGAIQRVNIRKVYIGVDRKIAKKYGFDDSKFYEDLKSINENKRNTINFHRGILSCADANNFLEKCSSLNWELHAGKHFLHKNFVKLFDAEEKKELIKVEERHLNVLKEQISKILKKHEEGKQVTNKHISPFSAIISKNGEIISECFDKDDAIDLTDTVEISAIRKACKKLQTHDLKGCCMYTIIEPDVLSVTAAMWARIDCIYVGVCKERAASYGYIYSYLQYKEFNCNLEDRLTKIIDSNMAEEAELVFKEWQENEGVVY